MTTSFPKDHIRILLAENISETAVETFRQAGYTNITTLPGALSPEQLQTALTDVHILGIRSKTDLSVEALAAAPKLLSVGCFCIGTNQVAKDAAADRGIALFNAPHSNTRSVAEMTIGAAIMLIRQIPDKNKAAHEGIWHKDATSSRELRGKTLGIVGYGNIGSQVSVLAEALGMTVVFYDVEKRLPLGNARALPSLQAVLQTSDILTLHVPATAATRHLINAETLRLMKPGALLINYARGEITDFTALREARLSGHLGGLAADVFAEEPQRNGDVFHSPVQGLSNTLLTPHIGGSTEEAQAHIGLDVSEKLLSFLETGATRGSLTVPELTLPPQEGAHRILHMHRNQPGVLGQINTLMAQKGLNILGQYLKTRDRLGYVVLDVDQAVSGDAAKMLREVAGTIRVRVVY